MSDPPASAELWNLFRELNFRTSCVCSQLPDIADSCPIVGPFTEEIDTFVPFDGLPFPLVSAVYFNGAVFLSVAAAATVAPGAGPHLLGTLSSQFQPSSAETFALFNNNASGTNMTSTITVGTDGSVTLSTLGTIGFPAFTSDRVNGTFVYSTL